MFKGQNSIGQEISGTKRMGRKACPKSAEDRTEDIKKYARLAYNRAVVLSKQNQHAWKVAVELLDKSAFDIYVQPTGEGKGSVQGLPDKLSAAIRDILVELVKDKVRFNEEMAKLQDNHGATLHQEVGHKETNLYKNCRYRGSN